MLLKGKLTTFESVVADANDIEFAFTFETPQEEQQDVNVVHHNAPSMATDFQKLQSVLEQVMKRLEAVETKIETPSTLTQCYNSQQL